MALKPVSELTFYSFQTHSPGGMLGIRNACYDFWKSSWNQTFRELEVDKILHSDDFLNRYLSGLFLGAKPIGFMLHKLLDLNHPAEKETEYFHRYPEHLKQHHFSAKDKVMVISFMTLDPEWRKSKTDLPLSEIIMGLSVCHFIESNADRLIGYFRNNRKTNEMFYRHGGRPISQSKAYNVSVDYGEIQKRDARLSTDQVSANATLKFWTEYKQRRLNNETSEFDEIVNETSRERFRKLFLG